MYFNSILEVLQGILGWAFALLCFNLVLSVFFHNIGTILIVIFIEIVCALAYAFYLIRRINDPAPRVVSYSRCYRGYADAKYKMDEKANDEKRTLTWEEKQVARELEIAQKYIFK